MPLAAAVGKAATVATVAAGAGAMAYANYKRMEALRAVDAEAAVRREERETLLREWAERAASDPHGFEAAMRRTERQNSALERCHEAYCRERDRQLRRLRERAEETQERASAGALLALPLLGTETSPDMVVLTALTLLGDEGGVQRDAFAPFLGSAINTDSPLNVLALSDFCCVLTEYSAAAAELLRTFLDEIARLVSSKFPLIARDDELYTAVLRLCITGTHRVIKVALSASNDWRALEQELLSLGLSALREKYTAGRCTRNKRYNKRYKRYESAKYVYELKDFLPESVGAGETIFLATFDIRGGVGFAPAEITVENGQEMYSFPTNQELWRKKLGELKLTAAPKIVDLDKDVAKARQSFYATGELSGRARVALERVGRYDMGRYDNLLVGATLEHAQALSGALGTALVTIDEALDEALDEDEDANVFVFTERLRQADSRILEDGGDGKISRQLAAELRRSAPPPSSDEVGMRALGKEVDDFCSNMLALIKVLLVHTPLNTRGQTPQQMCASRDVREVAMEGVLMPQSKTARLRYNLAQLERKRERAAVNTGDLPGWWPPRFWAGVCAVASVIFFSMCLGCSEVQQNPLIWTAIRTLVPGLPRAPAPHGMFSAAGWLVVVVPSMWGAKACCDAFKNALVLGVCDANGMPIARTYANASRRAYCWLAERQNWPAPVARDVAKLRYACGVTLGTWARRLGFERMREAVARGAIGGSDVLRLMDQLEESSRQLRPPESSSDDARVEIVLPGGDAAEVFLDVGVEEDAPPTARAETLRLGGGLQDGIRDERLGAPLRLAAEPHREGDTAQPGDESEAEQSDESEAAADAAPVAPCDTATSSLVPAADPMDAGAELDPATAAWVAARAVEEAEAAVQSQALLEAQQQAEAEAAGSSRAERSRPRTGRNVDKYLKAHGWELKRRKAHLIYTRKVGAVKQTYTRAATPSDGARGARNAVGTLRKLEWVAKEATAENQQREAAASSAASGSTGRGGRKGKGRPNKGKLEQRIAEEAAKLEEARRREEAAVAECEAAALRRAEEERLREIERRAEAAAEEKRQKEAAQRREREAAERRKCEAAEAQRRREAKAHSEAQLAREREALAEQRRVEQAALAGERKAKREARKAERLAAKRKEEEEELRRAEERRQAEAAQRRTEELERKAAEEATDFLFMQEV